MAQGIGTLRGEVCVSRGCEGHRNRAGSRWGLGRASRPERRHWHFGTSASPRQVPDTWLAAALERLWRGDVPSFPYYSVRYRPFASINGQGGTRGEEEAARAHREPLVFCSPAPRVHERPPASLVDVGDVHVEADILGRDADGRALQAAHPRSLRAVLSPPPLATRLGRIAFMIHFPADADFRGAGRCRGHREGLRRGDIATHL